MKYVPNIQKGKVKIHPKDDKFKIVSSKESSLGHYKIFCVNGNTGFRNESRIFYFIHLQNEEAYERKESSSA